MDAQTLWDWLSKPDNQQTLAWIGGGVIAGVAGLWAVLKFLRGKRRFGDYYRRGLERSAELSVSRSADMGMCDEIFINKKFNTTHDEITDLQRFRFPIKVYKRKKMRFSVSYPRLLSKGRSSLFIFHAYPQDVVEQARAQIQHLMSIHDLKENSASSERRVGDRIMVRLHCPVIKFSPNQATLKIEDQLNKTSFVGIPVDSCIPGKHDALITISDVDTKDSYESIEFTIKIIDYVIDHVSRPLMSNLSSAFLGILSAGSFILTSLKEIDSTIGLTAGTAAATLTAVIFGWGYLPFRASKTVEGSIST